MFLVNRLFGINASNPTAELMIIEGGRLFLVRPESIKGSRECIFIDASISIRRTTHEFAYQLVVTRTFQEGEELLLEEDTENSDERSFLLDASLFLSLGPTLDPSASSPPPLSLTWLDPDGDSPDDEFEFVLSQEGGENAMDLALNFERLTWRCMWERRERKSWPLDSREAKRVEDLLEDEFRVERIAPPVISKVPLFREEQDHSLSDTEDEEDIKPIHSPPSKSTSTSKSKSKASIPIPTPQAQDQKPDDKSSTNNSDDELAAALLTKAIISSPPPVVATSTTSTKSKGKARALTPPPPPISATSSNPPPPPPTSQAPNSTTTSLPLVSVIGQLHLFDRETGLFMMQEEEVNASIHRTNEGYWLLVEGKAGIWVSQGVEKDMVINFSEKELAMVFNFRYDDDSPTSPSSDSQSQSQTFTWLLRFLSPEPFNQMQEGISTALFEGKWGNGSWKKLKEDERDYQKLAYIEDSEMRGIEEDEREMVEREREMEREEVEREEEEEEEESGGEEDSEEDERGSFAPKGNKAKNSQLAVGYKEDLSFVVQGDMIGVFKQQREGGKKLKFMTSIVNISTPDGKKNFTPQKVMLHNQDTSMILQNPLAPGSLYRLDLETGKVVDEYKVSSNISISNFIPDSKFAQTTQQQTFIGLSHNGLFRVDPRLNGDKLVESEFKQYVTKNDFSVAATTESGKLAVASNKGDIRLFDKLGKNAKTALPALGDPILGIDVSADGRWVLATCKTYLLLIDTTIPEGVGSKFEGSSGFDRSFPANAKPTPRRLQLKPEHVAHMQEQSREGVSFTPAKFNAGLNEVERTIVTSTGPYIVAWNFRHVKAGNTSNYTLRRFSDTVIADAFKFGGDREIVVTLPGNVFVEEKKKLKAPTRESMARIVNTWD